MKTRLKNTKMFGLLIALLFVLAGCGQPHLSVLRPAGEVADKQFFLLMLSIGIMLLVIIVVVIIFLLAMIKFRRKKLGEDFVPKDVEGNHKLELVWTIIPVILLIILAIPTDRKSVV